MIAFNNVSFNYDTSKALENVSISFYPGKIYVIMGRNGAGKSTLLKHMNGLLKPVSGTVTVDGLDTRKSSVAELCKYVGLVIQNPELQFFSDNVFNEVAFGPRNFGLEGEDLRKVVEETLSLVGLSKYTERSPWSLSGGEMRRLALASILALNPRYLCLDEPTIGQDRRYKNILIDILYGLKVKGKGIIVATHDVEWVSSLRPDTVVLLHEGRIVYVGGLRDAFTRENLLQKCGLVTPFLFSLGMKLKIKPEELPLTFDGLIKRFLGV